MEVKVHPNGSNTRSPNNTKGLTAFGIIFYMEKYTQTVGSFLLLMFLPIDTE